MRNTQPKSIRYEKKFPEEWVSKVTCFICTELVFLPNKMFKNQNKCAHQICVRCMIKYIDTKLDDGLYRIKCPVLNCAHYLDPVSCRPDIPCRVFNRWCDLLFEFAVLRIDKCFCPYNKCSTLILNECGGNTVSKSKCPNCKKLFCFSCKVAWHEGWSCEEAKQLRDWHDVASGVLAKNKKWTRCPTCHHCVERVDGCNTVICRCRTSFCYQCGRKVQGQHSCQINYYTSESDAFCSLIIVLSVVISVFIVIFGLVCFVNFVVT